ncbi:hypothetical protein CEP51_009157 [Fusarium floridanum]|uniref:Uncharacterized protein n=1 Tax=Fusarium floridanum TaxID=1325733 RepID=A0A428RIK0_9HYPO|nr:hypothetical protein CEP51_009157 [Fusarium floridanum]
MATRKGPFRLVTVNTAPERAKRLIGRLIDALKEDYDITHVDNCESIDQVVPKVTEHRPNVLPYRLDKLIKPGGSWHPCFMQVLFLI